MTKLSKAQENTLNQAKKLIDRARSCETFDQYFKIIRRMSMDEYKSKYDGFINCDKYFNRLNNEYENEKNAIVIMNAHTTTLNKLESMGMIEIIKLDETSQLKFDTIKVLNY